MSGYTETAFGLRPFEPYDHASDAEELDADRDNREAFVRFYPCQKCDGTGARVERNAGVKTAVLCARCDGEGQLGATEEMIEAASSIGSDNPTCHHRWNQSAGEADENGGRIYCFDCGADGDA